MRKTSPNRPEHRGHHVFALRPNPLLAHPAGSIRSPSQPSTQAAEMTILRRLFAGSRVSPLTASRRRRNPARGQSRLSDVLEQLEQRRVLAVTYQGVGAFTNVTGDQESFAYTVNVQKSSPSDLGELWVRYNAQYNRIDFDTNSGFTNISRFVPVTPTASLGGPISAPFSVNAIVTVIDANWNAPTAKEDFHSGMIQIIGGAGTSVHLANGDPLPLGLNITLTPDVASPTSINLNGPVDTTTNVWASNPLVLNHTLTANQITLAAPFTDSGENFFRARDGIEFRNTITTGRVTSITDCP